MIKSLFKIALLGTLTVAMQSCAIYYRDADSGAEHIWGFGHLAMKATPPLDGKQTVVRRATLAGVALGIDDGSLGVSVGWDQRERIDVFDESTAVTIERPPSNDFFYFKIGTYPIDLANPENNKELQEKEIDYEK